MPRSVDLPTPTCCESVTGVSNHYVLKQIVVLSRVHNIKISLFRLSHPLRRYVQLYLSRLHHLQLSQLPYVPHSQVVELLALSLLGFPEVGEEGRPLVLLFLFELS